VSVSRLFVRRAVLCGAALALAFVGTGLFGKMIPAGFVPDEDQGLFMINVQLPPASSLERTDGVLRKVEAILARTEGIEAFNAIGGLGILTNSYNTNYGTLFIRLKPWEERKAPSST
jgi:multidrug efflux pump subunit AcrB